jgi:molybdenum cofactor cytidylyltransferase
MITAIVLAAGESKRMGEPKLLMPWGKSTVLQTVISTLQASGLSDILVVTGGFQSQIESLIGRTVQTVFNKDYATGDMLTSIQIGLEVKKHESAAALICLGDQPQVQERSVRLVRDMFQRNKSRIIVPSYENHRGHPWLVARPLWDEIFTMKAPQSPRDFLNAHAKEIRYIEMDTPTVTQDLDTPEDYLKYKP